MEKRKQTAPGTLLYLAAWLICTLLLVGDVLLIREATLDVMTVVQQKQIEKAPEGEQNAERLRVGFVKEMVDRTILIVGGVAAVPLSILIEHYFRKGREEGLMGKRIIKVVGIQLAIIAVCVLVQTLV